MAIEGRYGLSVAVMGDATLVPPDHRIDRLRPLADKTEEEAAELEQAEVEPADEGVAALADRDEVGKRGRRRRLRRKRRSDEEGQAQREVATAIEAEGEPQVEEEDLNVEVPELALGGERRAVKPKTAAARQTRRQAPPSAGTRQPSETEMDAIDEPEEGADFIAADEVEAETAEPLEMRQTKDRDDGEDETLHGRRRSRRQDTRKGASREVERDASAADAEHSAAAKMPNSHDDAAESRERAKISLKQASPIGGEEEPIYDETDESPEEGIQIMLVGGARPAIEEPTTEEAQANAEQSDLRELPLAAETTPLQKRPMINNGRGRRTMRRWSSWVRLAGRYRRMEGTRKRRGPSSRCKFPYSSTVLVLTHREADHDHSKAEVGPTTMLPLHRPTRTSGRCIASVLRRSGTPSKGATYGGDPRRRTRGAR